MKILTAIQSRIVGSSHGAFRWKRGLIHGMER